MSTFHFYHPIEIRYGDLDPQGHLNNAAYLTLFEQARICYLRRLGLFREGQFFLDIGVILADVHIAFKKPVEWGMPVRVGVHIVKIGNKSITVEQNIVHAETGEVFAAGEVVMVTYDYRTGRSIPVPPEWREIIQRFEDL